ncbi:isochorismatase family protein [Asticcacaulis sp. EMRT-3]|uniref:isochorismatase family protein n=1 Tax=Asticcacaulis sp. EMRT-3 TaxID=3040349 RepID=UPI0024AE921F|nr:isochorismatase family protein [Asticcacaulis sp. EMRT-3]MDI7775724.1 isochorismatase family protein [Asticcacaulis sp. EMRT-3]
MTVTTLDAQTALIVVDLQKGITAYPTAHPIAGVIEKAAQLTEAFRRKGLPVVLVNVTGGAPGRSETPRPPRDFPADFADLVPELNPQASDHLVTKRTWGAFTGTGLGDILAKAGVTQVVICGVATSIGVESTARFAHEAGLNVTLASDAMTDMQAEAHQNSVARIFPRLGETGTVAEILALLE